MGDLLDLFKVLIGKRFPFQLIYSNEYWMVESGKHVFPLQKYRLVYENLLAMGAKKDNFLRPRPAPDEDAVGLRQLSERDRRTDVEITIAPDALHAGHASGTRCAKCANHWHGRSSRMAKA